MSIQKLLAVPLLEHLQLLPVAMAVLQDDFDRYHAGRDNRHVTVGNNNASTKK
jgi:hypothetical protein